MRWFVLLLVACGATPPPAPAPVPDDLPQESGLVVCANLGKLGCPEGLQDTCIAVVDKVQRDRLTNLHTGCLAAAKSKEAARACRSVKCE